MESFLHSGANGFTFSFGGGGSGFTSSIWWVWIHFFILGSMDSLLHSGGGYRFTILWSMDSHLHSVRYRFSSSFCGVWIHFFILYGLISDFEAMDSPPHLGGG